MSDLMHKATRLQRRIAASADAGPQVVFVDGQGRIDRVTVGSERHKALEARPDFFRRVAGVFDSSATPALLASALWEVLP